jgi:2-polyprenyl-6-methoxyphenol hydroxylase-like FAD-dependent oxidoreductase
MQAHEPKILIVGAGPTGLTLATELARQGIMPRIIDRKDGPSPLSRAVGINPHTLGLLEGSGITARLLEEGVRINSAQVHFAKRGPAAVIDITSARDFKHNYILALPQDRTEGLMQAAFEGFGGTVEYGRGFSALVQKDDGKVEVTTQKGKDGPSITETFDAVVGADGVHSRVRAAAGIETQGHDYPTKWSITDFNCTDWPYPKDQIQYFMKDDGTAAIVLAMGENRYRAASNREVTIPHIPCNFTIGKMNRKADYKISVKLADTYQKGSVFLAGDAGDVHSPAGGRGMNRGIADACSLAAHFVAGNMDGYASERRAFAHDVNLKTDHAVARAGTTNAFAKAMVRNGLTLASRVPVRAVQRGLVREFFGF